MKKLLIVLSVVAMLFAFMVPVYANGFGPDGGITFINVEALSQTGGGTDVTYVGLASTFSGAGANAVAGEKHNVAFTATNTEGFSITKVFGLGSAGSAYDAFAAGKVSFANLPNHSCGR